MWGMKILRCDSCPGGAGRGGWWWFWELRERVLVLLEFHGSFICGVPIWWRLKGWRVEGFISVLLYRSSCSIQLACACVLCFRIIQEKAFIHSLYAREKMLSLWDFCNCFICLRVDTWISILLWVIHAIIFFFLCWIYEKLWCWGLTPVVFS